MADKELTVFLVDVGARMGHKTGDRTLSDLVLGMKYVQDIVATKVFRERKTDLVSLIYAEAANTKNSHDLEHISEEFDIVQPLYKHLKRLHPQPSDVEPSSSSAGIVRGLLFTFQKIVTFVGKRKYKKNVVIITNSKTPPELDKDYSDAVINLVSAAQINMTLIGIDFDNELTPEEQVNKDAWCELFSALPGSKIMNGFDVQNYLDQSNVRLVKPTRVFRGDLRIGSDLSNVDYEPEKDLKCVIIGVDAFPAVKPDRVPNRRVYGLNDEGKPVVIKSTTEYEIHHYIERAVNEEELDNNDEEELEAEQFTTEEVQDKSKIIKAYKYGKSVVVLNPALEEQRVYRTSPALDICGVVEIDTLPRCYLCGEAVFVVGREGSERDSLAISAFVDELTQLDSCAIARYVAKGNAEVQMVVLIPAYVNNLGEVVQRKRTHDDSGDYPRTLVMTRLPYYEDEKIAAFPDLSQLVTTSGKLITGDHPLLPSSEAIDTMTQFVESMDLDKLQDKESDFEGNRRIFNAMTTDQSRMHHDILVRDAIGIQRLNQVIKNIAVESSKCKNGLEEYCSSKDIVPPMSAKTIVVTNAPESLKDQSRPLLEKLERELHTEKIEKVRVRKRRVIEQAVEPDGEDELSLEKLLMRGKRD